MRSEGAYRRAAAWCVVFFFALLMAACAMLFFAMTWPGNAFDPTTPEGTTEVLVLLGHLSKKQIALFGAVFALAAAAGLSMVEGRTGWLRFLCRWRWAVALGVLFICVCLELNSTSLDWWTWYFPSGDVKHPLFGTAREIRSDEFAVWTPMAIAQDHAGYPAVNPLIGNGTDTLWVSIGGLPAWNAATLFKPLYWGFLLLGAAKGLSFLYALRFVLLFLVSFELALRYTQGNKWYSLTIGVLLTFAPYVQWLLSQSIAEVLIFGQGMVLCLWRYLDADKDWQRTLWGVGLAWCLGCYVMIAYPAWLISVLYFLLAFMVALLVISRKRLRLRRNALRLGLPLLCAAALLGVIVWQGWDALSRVMGSAYPGHRFETGGYFYINQRIGLGSMFLPMMTSVQNPCDLANFISLPPLGALLALLVLIRERKRDPLLIALLLTEAFFLAYFLFGFPAWLAKATFLYQCQPVRCVAAVGLTDTVLLFRGLSLSGAKRRVTCAGLTLITTGLSAWLMYTVLPDKALLIAGCAGLTALLSGLLAGSAGRSPRLAAFGLCCVMLVVGGQVNPVQQGISPVTELDTVKTIQAVNAPDDAVWIVESAYPQMQVPLFAGVHAINSTQEYPDLALWRKLDPEGTSEAIYNRFAHIGMLLTDEPTTFELYNDAYFILHLNPADLKLLGVEYLLTASEYPPLWNGVRFTQVEADERFRVYRISYGEAVSRTQNGIL